MNLFNSKLLMIMPKIENRILDGFIFIYKDSKSRYKKVSQLTDLEKLKIQFYFEERI